MTVHEQLAGWPMLLSELNKTYFINLGKYIAKRRKEVQIYPSKEEVFRAFRLSPFTSTKVIIVGQDPYHDGNATGVAFGVKHKVTPSLQKIFEYLLWAQQIGDLDFHPYDQTLTNWASQGVLLINRCLTVEQGKPNSHKGIGWEEFTATTIKQANNLPFAIFMLWGRNAQELAPLVSDKHVILTAEHPAAASYAGRMWNARKCFQTANQLLMDHGMIPINW